MPKFIITTLGCKVNQYESETIAAALEKSGWTDEAQSAAGAEVCIINTCAVTRKAAMQSRQAVRQALKAHPGARILVTGCYAQTDPDALKKIAGISCVLGHAAKHAIPDMLTSPPDSPGPLAAVGFKPAAAPPFREPALTVPKSRTRPFLKIQDGCDAFCSYCIVPYARGRSCSMPFENVMENIRRLARAGFHEVVLCGVHLGCYGQDLDPPASLFAVLRQVDSDRPIDRLRLSSIEPREISEDIINLTAASKQLCHHFHIPLQSGDDTILERMKRPYSRSFFRELVLKIRAAMPDAAIGADVLIGFPGETEAAFQNTVDLIEELPLTYLHVFPFSARKGTPADTFTGKVPAQVIKSRCHSLRQIGAAIKKDFYRRFIGRTLPVLIEGRRDASGMLKGFTANYLPVGLSGGDNLKNTIVPVRIESIEKDLTLRGTLSE
ncbi:MAG: tRNA (N(6)-L-threonylcarbamoyladenosine(37)-C(2))-methylthiotransferase MtaB [Desulfobacterales bacterium]|nr:tRNA (N(6)-L-threonylcarbamoyladenosine(37)-C(2))-methylthiotransferase MtaB [Desulfobacterales bacterium]